MKKIIMILVCVFTLVKMQAVPAYPNPVTVTQPDGTSLVILGQGDEYYHFLTTADGYTIVKNEAGYYVYAQLTDGALAPTTRIARNVEQRSASDNEFLAATGKFLIEQTKVAEAHKARQKVSTKESKSYYDNFRGLVILVNFKDKKFSRSDADSVYYHMFNDKNYSGYRNEDSTYNQYGSMFIGSVSDYFGANSMEQFRPHFDVVGPVDIDMGCLECSGSSKGHNACDLAVQAADSIVDFSQYDANGDGYVDMIFFLVAGYGSNYSGNDSGYLWPHKSSLYYWDKNTYDGKKLSTYACSIELYGWEDKGYTILDGIGTVCHEFSHVIGLPDTYDTDYASSGGQSNHPGQWDVMAGGGYLNYSRTPVGYSAFERDMLGFLTPDTISTTGTYSFEALQNSNKAYLLPTPKGNEYFLLENRQKTGWDKALPGHGMLVWRVDYSSTSPWSSNRINANPAHNYLEIRRAGNGTSTQDASDAFPGTKNVSEINNYTSPNLKTWDGTENRYALSAISEEMGVVSFKVIDGNVTYVLYEGFENMPATTSTSATGVQGNFAKWNFTKCNVTAPGTTNCSDLQAVAMKKPSAITMTEATSHNPYMITMRITNPSTVTAKVGLLYEAPGDSAWTEANPGAYEVAAGTTDTVTWTMDLTGPHYYRITETAGSANAKIYIDDLTFHFIKITGDVNHDGMVNVTDASSMLSWILGTFDYTQDFDANEFDLNGDGTVDVTDLAALVKLILN